MPRQVTSDWNWNEHMNFALDALRILKQVIGTPQVYQLILPQLENLRQLLKELIKVGNEAVKDVQTAIITLFVEVKALAEKLENFDARTAMQYLPDIEENLNLLTGQIREITDNRDQQPAAILVELEGAQEYARIIFDQLGNANEKAKGENNSLYMSHMVASATAGAKFSFYVSSAIFGILSCVVLVNHPHEIFRVIAISLLWIGFITSVASMIGFFIGAIRGWPSRYNNNKRIKCETKKKALELEIEVLRMKICAKRLLLTEGVSEEIRDQNQKVIKDMEKLEKRMKM